MSPALRLVAVVVASVAALIGAALGPSRTAPADAPSAIPFPMVATLPAAARSHALPLAGNAVYDAATVQANIIGVLAVSPGLQSGTIAPGETWSFNERWWSDTRDLATAYGVLGAGVCDLAALYADAAAQLGLAVSFTDHSPIDLRYAPSSANVAIWGVPGQRGGADLLITNTTIRPIAYAVYEDGGAYLVAMWEEP